MNLNIEKLESKDYRLNSVLNTLMFLRDDYPEIDIWYKNKVLPSIENNGRQIFIVGSISNISGVLILKNTKEEKKICTLFLNKYMRYNGIGSKLMNIAFNELNTDKPLMTISDTHIKEYEGIIKKFKLTLDDAVPNYYKDNHIEYSFNGHIYIPSNYCYA